jgi:hypothetical protein
MRIVSTGLYVLAGIAGAGFALCLAAGLGGLLGYVELAEIGSAILFPGIFVVFLPTVIVGNLLAQGSPAKDFWKAALRGAPSWLRYTVWGSWGLAAISFMALWLVRDGDQSVRASPGLLFAAVFYSTSAAVLFSAARTGLNPRRCPNGHEVAADAGFCSQCGKTVTG